jgi:ribosomal protein S18 acetylase RimI-like enzyme
MTTDFTTEIIYSTQKDKHAIMAILKDTGFFRPDEVIIAEEVLDDALKNGTAGHYQSFVSKHGDTVTGWLCYGPTPCTIGTFDIYWIAVGPQFQNKGIGKALINFAIEKIKTLGGRIAVIDTSGNSLYESTRHFYLKTGFIQEACIKDFYAPNDDMVIYIKRI